MTIHIDFEQARFNMIEQQIRPWEVLDQRVLDLLQEVHREDFVAENYRALALADMNIPLAHGQVMMSPKLEARLLQALAIEKYDSVLEIGTGSAYLTALLAKSARQVDSIDIFPDFINEAAGKLDSQQVKNVHLEVRDVFQDWQTERRYDIIVVTGSVPRLDPRLQGKLNTGGRLFIIVGESPIMEARLITCAGRHEWASEALFETEIAPLIGAEKPSTFHL